MAGVKRMGYSTHPGPLPFTTIRSSKWANYTWPGEVIEIHGEHGCDMPAMPARVLSIGKHDGPCPAHLVNVYRGKELYGIALEAA